ncbi:MAG: hypothetical protein HOE90_16170 [Bacteriovoracaceae bacterium]|jgi:hypothetical protein|nr:hypothetical protein [Bacteriovoracaceae bacterium]
MKLLLPLILLLSSCSGEDKYGRKEAFDMIKASDPNIEFIIPSDLSKGIQCSDYGPGCIGGITVRIKFLEVIIVEFQNSDQARAEAMRIGQWYSKNFVFDDVMGEPMMEDYFKQLFSAKPGIIYEAKPADSK